MKKFIEQLGTWLPMVWAIGIITIITGGIIGVSIKIIECILSLLGVL